MIDELISYLQSCKEKSDDVSFLICNKNSKVFYKFERVMLIADVENAAIIIEIGDEEPMDDEEDIIL